MLFLLSRYWLVKYRLARRKVSEVFFAYLALCKFGLGSYRGIFELHCRLMNLVLCIVHDIFELLFDVGILAILFRKLSVSVYSLKVKLRYDNYLFALQFLGL